MTTSVGQMWVRRIPDWRTRKIYEELPTPARDGVEFRRTWRR
jgi:hypothetical protein